MVKREWVWFREIASALHEFGGLIRVVQTDPKSDFSVTSG